MPTEYETQSNEVADLKEDVAHYDGHDAVATGAVLETRYAGGWFSAARGSGADYRPRSSPDRQGLLEGDGLLLDPQLGCAERRRGFLIS